MVENPYKEITVTDYTKKPVSDLLDEAQKGDLGAQQALGLLSELGLGGVDSDMLVALQWYERAAQQGDGFAALTAASIFEQGIGTVPKDQATADAFYKMAEDLGYERPKERHDKSLGKAVKEGKKILIVDSSDTGRVAVEKRLDHAKYQSIGVGNVTELKAALKNNPDIYCAFVEIKIFEPNVFEGLKILRDNRETKEIPIIVLTTISEPEVIKKAKSFGINGWLLKPTNLELVEKTARRFA